MLSVRENVRGEKYQKLQELKERLNFIIEGLENYPEGDRPIYFIANHSCLMDIFYLSMAVPDNQVTVVSNRIVYKPIKEKQETVNKYLYTLPLEPTGKKYADITINAASGLLASGINLSIFPEGVYNDRTAITRGRTGMARILFDTCKKGINPYLVPIAIDVDTEDNTLDRYKICEDDKVIVKILEPIDYEYLIKDYICSDNRDEKNAILHEVTDTGMINIANALGVPFTGTYKPAIPKDNIMFQDGSTIPLEAADLDVNINRFQEEIDNRAQRLVRVLKK